MLLRDRVVETRRHVVGVRIEVVGAERARVEAVLRDEQVAELLQVRLLRVRHAGDGAGRVAREAGAEELARIRAPPEFAGDEQEGLVADDGTAEREAVAVLREVVDLERRRVGVAHLVAHEALVAHVGVGRAFEAVRAALGHDVDAGAGKLALAHVIGSDVDLDLLNRVERDRLRVGLPTDFAREAEDVVEDRAVDRDVVVEVVAPGDRVVEARRGRLRGEPRKVGHGAVERRQRLDLLRRDVRRRAGALGGDDGVAVRLDHHLIARHVFLAERHVEREVLPERKLHVVADERPVAGERDGHAVRPTHAEPLEVEAAVGACHVAVARARWHVDRDDGGASEAFAVGTVDDLPADRGRRDVLRVRRGQPA